VSGAPGGEVVFNAEPFGFSARARAAWESVGSYHEGTLDDPDSQPVRERATVLIVRLARRIDAAVLSRFPRLRWLVSATTGLDHVDLDLAASRGIEVLSLRGEAEFLATIPSTAEHTMALLLALVRKLPAAVQSVARGEWTRDAFRGRQLKDRRIGLVGLGRTGRMVAEYAQAFGMHVGYYDPGAEDRRFERFATLAALLRRSEILSLHLHLDDGTRGLIGADAIAGLPRGAWVVNTSRGGLVDEGAVAAALRSGHLAGVATDVLADELGAIESSPLWAAMRDGLPVLITPHLGGATMDAMEQCEEFVAARFAAATRGAVPR
jgi:D-3-phosphoglycerate dehydrogenase